MIIMGGVSRRASLGSSVRYISTCRAFNNVLNSAVAPSWILKLKVEATHPNPAIKAARLNSQISKHNKIHQHKIQDASTRDITCKSRFSGPMDFIDVDSWLALRVGKVL